MLGETDENWQRASRRRIALEPDSVTIYQMELPFNTTIAKDAQGARRTSTTPVAPTGRPKRRWVDEAFRRSRRRLPRRSAYTPVKIRRRTRFVYRDRSGRAPTWSAWASRRSGTSTACTCRTSTRGRPTARDRPRRVAAQSGYRCTARGRLTNSSRRSSNDTRCSSSWSSVHVPGTYPFRQWIASVNSAITCRGNRTAPRVARRQQVAGAAQHVGHALLVDRLLEPVVRGEPVVAQDARPVPADHPLQDVGTALGVDGVRGGPVTDPGVEPGRVPSDPPPRLVGRDLLGRPHLVEDQVVVRFQAGRGPQVDLGAGPAGQRDAEQGLEDRRDLAVRQAHLGVQDRGGGLGVGADLAGGRAQGVGRLERVPALGPLAARLAVADVDAELADQRRAGDLGLELVGRAGLDEAAPAVRAGVGEVGLVALGDLFGRRRRAVAVGAVGVARLAAGRLRVGLGRPLAERGGLPLAGAEGVVELPGQLGDLGFEFGDTLEEFPAAGTRGLVHAAIVATGAAISGWTAARIPPAIAEASGDHLVNTVSLFRGVAFSAPGTAQPATPVARTAGAGLVNLSRPCWGDTLVGLTTGSATGLRPLSLTVELAMKKLLIVLLLLVVAAGSVGYWRGWFDFNKKTDTTDGKTNVGVNKDEFEATRLRAPPVNPRR